MEDYIKERIEKISEILSKIKKEKWNEIVQNEPEWKHLEKFKDWGFGKFATLMIAVALNDYRLKGKANVKYFPELKNFLEKEIGNRIPSSPEELEQILKKFYEKELSKNAKIKRLEKFLKSELVKRIWNLSIEDIPKENVSESLRKIHLELSEVMNQSPNKKTIVFAMKCLGIALMMHEIYDFEISISIPIDSRVRNFTQRILGNKNLSDKEIQEFWDEVLKKIREKVKINMIHLDSLIWQIGEFIKKEKMDEDGLRSYFENLGIKNIFEELIPLIKNEQ